MLDRKARVVVMSINADAPTGKQPSNSTLLTIWRGLARHQAAGMALLTIHPLQTSPFRKQPINPPFHFR